MHGKANGPTFSYTVYVICYSMLESHTCLICGEEIMEYCLNFL